MKQINFVVTGHGLINIFLGGTVVLLIGATCIVFLLPKSKSPDKVEIFLKKLSKLWTKDAVGEIHIAELAPIWRDEKAPLEDVRDYVFTHDVVSDFFIKYIEKAPWFSHAPLQKEVCCQILKMLDEEGDCPSVVNAADDVEASWDSNTFTLLGKTTLLGHTLNVAVKTISLLLEADARHVIPDGVIAALGHDLGKLARVKGHLYSLGEHPLAAGRVLAGIPSFKQLAKKDEISRAIKLHHKRPEGLLGKTLKNADQLARQKELEQAVEQFPAQDELQVLENRLPQVHGAKAAWQAQADIYDEEAPSTKKKKDPPNLIDISKWFDAGDFLGNLKPYINRVTGRRFMAFSMPDGHVYIQAKALEEVARKQAEQAGAMDIATMAADDSSMRQVLFTVVHHLRTNHDVVARGLIKDQYFGGYFIITMKSGKTLKGFYTPFHSEAFADQGQVAGALAKLESEKPEFLKNFVSVKPHLSSDTL